MATVAFKENFYAFRATERVVNTMLQAPTAEQAVLAAIEAKLVEANYDYLARRYQEAIAAYQDAGGMIYSHINPRYPIPIRMDLPLDAALFDPLLSASLEWLNIVPSRQPTVPVAPRVAVSARALAATAKIDTAGVVSSLLATPEGMAAAAGLATAKTMTSLGNKEAATFFTTRAQGISAQTTNVIGTVAAEAPAAGASPTTAAGPGGAGLAVGSGRVTAGGLAGNLVPRDAMARAAVVAPQVALLREPALTLPPAVNFDRVVGFSVAGGDVATFTWKPGAAPPLDNIKSSIYADRVKLGNLADIIRLPRQPSDVAARLPHDYYYTIPLGLAECYHALGDFAASEQKYFQAASYQFLNAAVEAPYIFQRLLTLYADWGDSLFRTGDAPQALSIYTRVLAPNFTAPASTLYATTSLKPGADVARTVIASLANASTLNVNPLICAPIVEIQAQILKIQNGLDFWGHRANSTPIWTFDYLQSVAINFAQLAISAERDFINFRDRADQASLTRLQIAQSISQSNSELQTAKLQAAAANAEVQAFADGAALANKRAADAAANASEYESTSAQAMIHQALSAQLSGGDDGDASQLNRLANRMMQGNYYLQDGRGTLSAAEQLTAMRLNQKYEVDAMKRTAQELQIAAKQGADEVKAAQIRAAAAQSAITTAQLRAQAAQQSLSAFDNQFFTPDVWHRMSDQMWRLYRRYFDMAIRSARLMQQAYNFETDQSLDLIKSDYSTDEVRGLLGADALMADIQSFTYDLITSKLGKPQPLRQTISLAQKYGFLFEKQFRKAGTMEFETRIDDFDAIYPGTFAGRIEAVEIAVDGIVPPSGISGTLTNSGISGYRTPAAIPASPGGLKYRVQNKETLVLSDYAVRNDALLVQNDSRKLKVFEGAGVASSWRLELPKQINDIDYGAITDIRLTFYYKARYDPDLHDKVIAGVATLPSFHSRQRGMPLRWLYPDGFFKFQDTGELKFTLRARDFANNESKPVIEQVGLVVVTDGSVSANGLKVSLATPGKTAATAPADGNGSIQSAGGSAWAPLNGGTAIGDYVLTLKAADNPALVSNGKLNVAPIVNLGFVLGYSFTPRS